MNSRSLPASRRFSAFARLRALLALGLALSVSGCLLISGRPISDFGDECAGDGDCASFGFCGATPSFGNVCLPKVAECTATSAGVCAGYACETRFGTAYAYCERSCRASADCATGFSCDFSRGDEGDCK